MQEQVTASPGQAVGRPVGVRGSTTYLPEIESLRGIAIALVYLFHLSSFVGFGPRSAQGQLLSPFWAFVRGGHTGVSLFFVLSGFLLSLPFLAEAAGAKRVDRRRYGLRRALRILPLYYAAVLVGTVMCAKEPADLLHGLPYLAFLNAIPAGVTALFPYSSTWWSLATEMQYYLVLPLLPFCLRSGVMRFIAIACFLIYAGAYAAYLGEWLRPGGDFMLRLSLFGRGPLFLEGIFVAWLYLHYGAQMRERLARLSWLRFGGADVLLLASIMGLAALLRWTLVIGYQPVETVPYFAWHLLEGALWATIVLLLLCAPLRLKTVIANPVSGRLGILSYSLYMWHVPVIVWMPKLLRRAGFHSYGRIEVAIFMTVTCLAVSQLTYTLIERPFLARKARVE